MTIRTLRDIQMAHCVSYGLIAVNISHELVENTQQLSKLKLNRPH